MACKRMSSSFLLAYSRAFWVENGAEVFIGGGRDRAVLWVNCSITVSFNDVDYRLRKG